MKRLFLYPLFALLIFIPSTEAQKGGKSWIFKHKIEGVTKAIEQGRPITIQWRGLGGIRTNSGKLVDIAADSTILAMKGGSKVSIPNDRITDIRAKSKSNVFARMLAGVLLYVGIFLLGAILLVLLISSPKTDENFPKGQLYLSIFSLLLGILILIGQPKPQRVRDPFGPNWALEEVLPATKKNTP